MEDRNPDDDVTERMEITQRSMPHRDVLNMGLKGEPKYLPQGAQARTGRTLMGVGPERGLRPLKASKTAEPAKPKEKEAKSVPTGPTLLAKKKSVFSIVTNRRRLAAFAVVAVLVIAALVYKISRKPDVSNNAEPVASMVASIAPSVVNVPPTASASAAVEDATIGLHPPAPAKPLVHKKPVAAAPPATTVEKTEMAPPEPATVTTTRPAAKYHSDLEE
ncbi:MAG: hypothetical protein FWD69_09790 [Polyangiaceae bacterium]|nr:hypothetical protein [Polyangiaceae bacterium]